MDQSAAIHRWRRRRRETRRGPNPALIAGQFMGASLILSVAVVFSLVAGVVWTGVTVYNSIVASLPDPTTIEGKNSEEFQTVKIYDRTGQRLLYESVDPRPFRGDRTVVPLVQIPLTLREATIALEDRSFYDNPGIDPRGIARALVSDLSGDSFQGASSITQQLIKNVIIAPEQRADPSLTRKVKEALLAVEITRRYSKDQILEWYLNRNFYGNFAYGVEAASRVYFDKPVEKLDLAESAMLAALPQYPALNPIDAPTDAKRRQLKVLDAMVAAGYITPVESAAAAAEQLTLRNSDIQRFGNSPAPHFAIYVLNELQKLFPDDPYYIYQKGARVYTTLDLDLQQAAEEIARKHIAELKGPDQNGEPRKVTNASLVAIRPQTGEILTMVGSLDYYNKEIDGQVNVALSERQPGSSFKPYTYLTAFQQGFSPASLIMDVRTVFPDVATGAYVPENYDRVYHGPLRLREALANSYNIPAVSLLNKVGIKNVINFAHKMGINSLNNDYYGLSLTLGGGEVRLIDHTYAFSVIANQGSMAGQPIDPRFQRPGYRVLDPVAVLEVTDKDGNSLYKYERPQVQSVISRQLAYLITSILSDTEARIPAFGRNNPLMLKDRPVAAKTGTTNDFRDNWTMGFTPDLAVGVWVGNSNNDPMGKVSGVDGAAPIWHDFMERANQGAPVKQFSMPDGIVRMEVCTPSGLLPTPECPKKVTEVFIQGNEPKTYDTIYRTFEINKSNGKLATAYTPANLRERRVFPVYPPEARDWVRDNHIPQPPTEFDTGDAISGDANVNISQPGRYSFIGGNYAIRGTVLVDDLRRWRVQVGEGLNPRSYTEIAEGGDRVQNGVLTYWSTPRAGGLYTILLQVETGSGNRSVATEVTVDNNPPKLDAYLAEDHNVFVLNDDEWVSVQADATDDWSMDHVDFFIDGKKFATSTVPPYNEKWVITMTNPSRLTLTNGVPYSETHKIFVEAFDAAGNMKKSDEMQIWVKAKPKPKAETGPAGQDERRKTDNPLRLSPPSSVFRPSSSPPEPWS